MTAQHDTAARRERQAAAALGSTRVHRRRGESAPDVLPLVLACGVELQPEVKSRKRLPRLVALALGQARRYRPGAVPLVAVYQAGTAGGIACLPLDAFARIAGLDVAKLPPPTPLRRPPAPRSEQLALPGVA